MFWQYFITDFTVKKNKKPGLFGYVYDFSVDYCRIDVNDILGFNKY